MLSFLTTTILLNSLSIPHPPFDPFYPPHPDVCSLSDKYNCLMIITVDGVKILHFRLMMMTTIFLIIPHIPHNP